MALKKAFNASIILCVLFLLCLGVTFPAVASQSANYQLWPAVYGASGNTPSSASYQVHNAIGQAASGIISTMLYSLQTGFLNEYSVAIPVSTNTPVCTVTATPSFTPTPLVTVTPTATPTPFFTATATSTPTMTATSVVQTTNAYSDFEGQIISKNYIYAAPNPIQGSTGRIFVYCKQRATGKIKIFTLLGQEVLSIERSFQVGRNVENIYMGNLANAMYYLFVRVRNDEGLEEKAKTKIILLK